MSVQAGSFAVALVTSKNTEVYKRVSNAIIAASQSVDAMEVVFSMLSSDDIENPGKAAQYDLLVPIGTHACELTLKHTTGTPVLATLIPKVSFQTLLDRSDVSRNDGTARNIHAVTLDTPVKRQLRLAQLIFGDKQKLGIAVGLNSNISRRELQQLLKEMNISGYIEELEPNQNISQQFAKIFDRSDALIAISDPLIYSATNARNILLSAYRKRTPIIGFSQAYVKAGALAAVYSTPEQIGIQTGELVVQLSQNHNIGLPQIIEPSLFSVAANIHVARSLGIELFDPEELQRKITIAERSDK